MLFNVEFMQSNKAYLSCKKVKILKVEETDLVVLELKIDKLHSSVKIRLKKISRAWWLTNGSKVLNIILQ